MFEGQPGGGGGGGNSEAAAVTSGMQMVPVSSARGGDDALRASAPLIRGDEEPKDVDPRPEAETRPLPFSDSSGVVTPTTLRRCQNRESNWLLSRLAPSNVEPAAMVFWRNCGVRGGVRRGGTSRVKRHGMDDDRSNSSRDTLIFPVVPETH